MGHPSPEPRSFVASDTASTPRTCDICGARFLGDHACSGALAPVRVAAARAAAAKGSDALPDLRKMPVAAALGVLQKLHKEEVPTLELVLRRFTTELAVRASSLGPVPAAEVLRGLSKLPITEATATTIVRSLLPRVVAGAASFNPAMSIAVCKSLELFLPHVDADTLSIVRSNLPPIVDRMTACLMSTKVFGITAVLRAVVLSGPLENRDVELHGALYRFCRSAIPLLRRLVLDVEPADVATVLRALAITGIDAALAARTGTFLEDLLPRCTKSPRDAGVILGLLGKLPLAREMRAPVLAFTSAVAHHLPKDLSPDLAASAIFTLGRIPLDERSKSLAAAWARTMSRFALSKLHTLSRDELLGLKTSLANLDALDPLSSDVLDLAIAKRSATT